MTDQDSCGEELSTDDGYHGEHEHCEEKEEKDDLSETNSELIGLVR